MEWLVTLQYAFTALLSAANATYFLSYRSPLRRRRWGAVVLALVSIAGVAQSIFFALLFARLDGHAVPLARWLVAGVLPLGAALLISTLILRQTFHRK